MKTIYNAYTLPGAIAITLLVWVTMVCKHGVIDAPEAMYESADDLDEYKKNNRTTFAIFSILLNTAFYMLVLY